MLDLLIVVKYFSCNISVDANNEREAEAVEERNDEEKSDDATTSTDAAFPEPAQQDQQAYLEPILVAMELGQEILQGNTGDDEQTTVSADDDGKAASAIKKKYLPTISFYVRLKNARVVR